MRRQLTILTDTDGLVPECATYAHGYHPKDRADFLQTVIEDLARAMIVAAPDNKIEIVINGIPVIVGEEEKPKWLRNIFEPKRSSGPNETSSS